jgi:hypothetical protein
LSWWTQTSCARCGVLGSSQIDRAGPGAPQLGDRAGQQLGADVAGGSLRVRPVAQRHLAGAFAGQRTPEDVVLVPPSVAVDDVGRGG